MISIEEIYRIFEMSTGVCTDTRKIEKGNIFFALKGPRFDGNKYALDAIKKGALFSVVDVPAYKLSDRCIWVPNVLTCLHRLAHHHRKTFDIPVIGITGTNGKTTTKELIVSVLSQKYRMHYTRGNLNNHIGVPLTILAMDAKTEIAIIEMGANHGGEIKMLCQIADPNFGIVTNVGKGHLEGFGSVKGVFKAKVELYDYLEGVEGRGYINREETCFNKIDLGNFTTIQSFSRQIFFNSGYRLKFISNNPSIRMELKTPKKAFQIQSSLFGSHNERNIVSAVAFGIEFQVVPELIVQGIQEYIAENNRSQIVKLGTNTFYLDAYNANPSSTELAIEFFDHLKSSPKIMILGDMLELGDSSLIEHKKIHKIVCDNKKFQRVIFVGPIYTKIGSDLNKMDDRVKYYSSVDQAKAYLDSAKLSHSFIYVKGSRSIQLEKLLV